MLCASMDFDEQPADRHQSVTTPGSTRAALKLMALHMDHIGIVVTDFPATMPVEDPGPPRS
ncbi:hypothetical protein GCM10010383_62890 [Streptomyces lomondensis]|uniref:Uncharacterized protein n=1 Tax=Streptomyces lomondensis TaxID=68229 RepID=A0ABQ2XM79_9ACTN|nr:hypothetical protein GCM10010383_62890 [Streptomyces lomondensis]